MEKLLFLFNPSSGKAKIRNRLFDIINYYTRQNFLVTVVPTQKRGDAKECIVELQRQFDRIICSGGDGTLSEVVSGFMEAGQTVPLGYIPSGSTNDFGRSMEIPADLNEALEISCSENVCDLDVGQFNDQYFVYVAAFGLFTNVTYSTPQDLKNSIGYIAYLLEGIKSLSELKSYEIELEHDHGIIHDRFILGLVLNSFSIAGWKNPLGAETSLDDGVFEVLLVRPPKSLQDLHDFVSVLLGENPMDINTEHVLYLQTSHLSIKSDPMEWTLDGEGSGLIEEVEIRNIQKVLKFIR